MYKKQLGKWVVKPASATGGLVPHKGAAEGVHLELLKLVQEVTATPVIGKLRCTTWSGPKDRYGKPTLYYKGSYYQPHRVVYEHRYGPLRQSDWVYRDAKECRDILCMTPEHMSVSSENVDGTRTRHHAAVSIDPAGMVLPPVTKRKELVLPKRPPGMQ